MLNIGFPELALIFTAALLLLGPKKLPEFARWVGQAVRDLRQATNEVRTAIDMELEREEFEKLQREFQDVVNTDFPDDESAAHHDDDATHHDDDAAHHDGDTGHQDTPSLAQIQTDDDGPSVDPQLAYPPMVDDQGQPVPLEENHGAGESTPATTEPSAVGFTPPTGPPPGTVSVGDDDFEDDDDDFKLHTSADHPTPDDYPDTPIPDDATEGANTTPAPSEATTDNAPEPPAENAEKPDQA